MATLLAGNILNPKGFNLLLFLSGGILLIVFYILLLFMERQSMDNSAYIGGIMMVYGMLTLVAVMGGVVLFLDWLGRRKHHKKSHR